MFHGANKCLDTSDYLEEVQVVKTVKSETPQKVIEDVNITLSPDAMKTFVGEVLCTAILDSGVQELFVDKRG